MPDLLPPLPDPATLEAMAWWSGTCAAIGLGAWAIAFIVTYRPGQAWTEACDRSGTEVPGHTSVPDEGRRWSAPRMALIMPLWGALGGALMGWYQSLSDDLDSLIQLVTELGTFVAALFVLTRVLRDTPAVGEAPPERTVAARLPAAIGKLALAGIMLVSAWMALN